MLGQSNDFINIVKQALAPSGASALPHIAACLKPRCSCRRERCGRIQTFPNCVAKPKTGCQTYCWR